MSACKYRKQTSVNCLKENCDFLIKLDRDKMRFLRLFVLVMIISVSVAYFLYCLPLVVSIFENRKQITSSEVLTTAGKTSTGTSIVKRSRQQSVPVNSGYLKLLFVSQHPAFYLKSSCN